MKSRIARLGVLLAAVAGLMATMTPSASATTVKTITFIGTAFIEGGGLGYPCTPAGTTNNCPPSVTTTTKPGPKGVPTVNVTPHGGNHRTFTFSSAANLCVKNSVSTPNKPNPKIGVAEPCSITAAGSVWGFCGLSEGVGSATLINLAGTKDSVSIPFKFTGIGGLLHVTGASGDRTRQLYGEVAAIPNPLPGTGTCTNKSATTFTIAGEAVYIDKTPPL